MGIILKLCYKSNNSGIFWTKNVPFHNRKTATLKTFKALIYNFYSQNKRHKILVKFLFHEIDHFNQIVQDIYYLQEPLDFYLWIGQKHPLFDFFLVSQIPLIYAYILNFGLRKHYLPHVEFRDYDKFPPLKKRKENNKIKEHDF